MTYPQYPKTDAQALAYAAELSPNHVAIRIPPGSNPFGITHAAVTRTELPEYLAAGCVQIKPEETQP